MSILLGNKILEAAEQKIESNLVPQVRANYQKIVVAGMKVALNGGPNSGMAKLRRSPDPVKQCAQGAVNLVLMLRRVSKGVMPMKAMVPAAMTLMLQALDFCDRTGVVKVGTPELVKATHIFTDAIFGRLGISKQMLHTAANNVHAITQDPAKMELIKRKVGIVKAPGASEPTPMPAAEGDTDVAD